jgi:quercetin dioxygenase-like cupin family protein
MQLSASIRSFFSAIFVIAACASPASAQHPVNDADMPDATRRKQGTAHKALLRTDLAGVSGQEVIVWDTEYSPRAINPRHYHPVAITFYVISGTGIWQEEGKPPVTLKAGDSLFTPAGTTHSHWNPSHTEKLRFLEFIAGPEDKTSPLPRPLEKRN